MKQLNLRLNFMAVFLTKATIMYALILYTAAAHVIRYDFHYIENYLDEMKEELIDERKEARFNWQMFNKSVI